MVINLRQNKNDDSTAYGKYYAEVDSKEPLHLKGGRWRPDVDRYKKKSQCLTKKRKEQKNGKIKHSNGD